MGFAYDLKDIYKYYGLYENLMEFWEEMFPNRIYKLDYEKLTINQKEETKKLLDYCGLEWEDGCMEFEKNKRAVRTASLNNEIMGSDLFILLLPPAFDGFYIFTNDLSLFSLSGRQCSTEEAL
jgi:hypothetical protein